MTRVRTLVAVLSVVCLFFDAAYSEAGSAEKEVDKLVAAVGHKFSVSPYLAQFRGVGRSAVPVLIKRYGTVEEEKRWPIAACLCAVPYDDAREFLLQIISDGKDERSIRWILREYPQVFDMELFPVILGRLDGAPVLKTEIAGRLRRAVVSTPLLAGQLVTALDDTDGEGNYVIYEILSGLCGRSHNWQPAKADTPQKRRQFWVDWWIKNKNMTQFDWVIASMYESNSLTRLKSTMQALSYLNDWQAIPLFMKGLDHSDREVRYWAVVGLRNLQEQIKDHSYSYDLFKKDEAQVIRSLKDEYVSAGKYRQQESRYEHDLPPSLRGK